MYVYHKRAKILFYMISSQKIKIKFMTKHKTTDVVGKIVEMLTPLTSDEKQRVIQASLVLLGETATDLNRGSLGGKPHEEIGNLPARAQTWISQNKLSAEELQQVFLIAEGGAEVIASEIPGKSKREKTYNAYMLTGIAKLLSTGNPSFDDKSARALCKSSGCLDSANHANYLKEKSNEFTGAKNKGWTLTTPGLKHGASLVKELNK